jgi:hypothetical protein
MQWMLNCYTNRSLLGPHLTALRRDIVAMAETTSVLTADPQVLAYTLGYERILRALTLQNQLGQPTISFCPLHAVQPFTSTTSTKPV